MASLKQRSKELEREVSEKLKAFEADEITADELEQVVKTADKESEKIGIAIKNVRAAQGLAGSSDPNPEGQPEHAQPMHLKEYQEGFEKLKEAANPKTRHPESVSFDFAFKSYQEDMRMKAQGVTGLSGEAASGTTAPSALAANSYFLTGTAGPFIQPEFVQPIVELRFYQNVIADLIPSYATDSPVVTWVRESTWTNNAAATPEGATKPTSTHSLQRFTAQVGKIANLERVTDELVMDAPMVWGLIQQRLVQGVQRQEEIELVAGAGYPGVGGLLSFAGSFQAPMTVPAVTNLSFPTAGTPGIGAAPDTVATVTPGRAVYGGAGAAAGTNPPTDIQIAEGLLRAITDIRVNTFFEPTAIIMNPLDYLTVRLAKDLNNQYYGGSMFGRDYGFAANEPTPQAVFQFGLWGLKTVATPAMPQGLALTGDFADWDRVLRRGGLRVDITNTNGTDFEQNLWTARAEERIGLMVERPEVHELVQFLNGA
jgi:HK97 family phage major capsid protein